MSVVDAWQWHIPHFLYVLNPSVLRCDEQTWLLISIIVVRRGSVSANHVRHELARVTHLLPAVPTSFSLAYPLYSPFITPPRTLTMSAPEEETLVDELREHDPTRPHSFDLTLELEQQLEAESIPTSPARLEGGRPQSLDAHVVASLVTSLRINVAELTKERDELSAALDAARGREAGLASELHQLKEAQVGQDAELAALRQKARDDEESIVLLRSKVEESRSVILCVRLCTTFSSHHCVVQKDAASCGCKPKGKLKVDA
jgi:hypothetical protein